jgi:hypothetical protein
MMLFGVTLESRRVHRAHHAEYRFGCKTEITHEFKKNRFLKINRMRFKPSKFTSKIK